MPDWSNPSEDDIKEAKEHGLDLTDETVRVCLRPHNVAMRTFKLATQVAAIVMVTGRAGAALRRGGRERIPSECQWRRGARTKRWRQRRWRRLRRRWRRLRQPEKAQGSLSHRIPNVKVRTGAPIVVVTCVVDLMRAGHARLSFLLLDE